MRCEHIEKELWISDPHLESVLSPQGTFVTVWRNFGCHSWSDDMIDLWGTTV